MMNSFSQLTMALCCVAACWVPLAPLEVHAEPFVVVDQGRAAAFIAVDMRGSTITQRGQNRNRTLYSQSEAYSLVTWGQFLAEQINGATGAAMEVRLEPSDEGRSIVISLAENYPDIARAAGLDPAARLADPIRHYDAFCIQSTADRLYILGHTELGCRHGVATLLEHMGFRFYSPSPRWWIGPRTKDLAVDLTMARSPAFFNVEFATNAGHHMNHGNGTETYLWDIQEIWYAMNRTSGLRFNPSPRFSAGPFAFDFTRSVKAELEEHPECFALLADGTRDIHKPVSARRICVSSRRMLDLIVRDRLALLETLRNRDRFHPMVSAEYGDGGCADCQCPDCVKLGSATDRLFTMVNAIARAVREKYPDALVAIRVGTNVPAIAVEKNVCVSASRRELVPAWAKKVAFVGTGHVLPGYVPGGGKNPAEQVAYYKELLRFCAENNVKSLQAGLAPAWGGLQTPMMYVATRMLWDPAVDAELLFQEYFELSFGKAAAPMRALWEKLRDRPYREDAHIAAMLADLSRAYELEDRADVRQRVVDVMFYVHGLILYRDFETEKDKQGKTRNDVFYDALLPLMKYLARNSYRSMMCPSVLAQAYCNQSALKDGREDFYWYRYEKLKPAQDPIWMDPQFPWRARPLVIRRGDPRVAATFHDEEILEQFREDLRQFTAGATE